MRQYEVMFSAAKLQMEKAQDIADILPMYHNEGFENSNLIIHQVTIRSGGQDLQTFDSMATKLTDVVLLRTSP